MSGAAGLRGYLLQSFVIVLDALESNEAWSAVSLEPGGALEKVDLIWHGLGPDRAVQVRSSQNQIGKADAEAWATEFEQSAAADDYLLVLLGPCSQWVIDAGYIGRVKVPPPRSVNIPDLVEQAAQRLDRYLERIDAPRVPARAREILVRALVAEFSTFSTESLRVSRTEFERVLRTWIGNLLKGYVDAGTLKSNELFVPLSILPDSASRVAKLDVLRRKRVFVICASLAALIFFVLLSVERTSAFSLLFGIPVALILLGWAQTDDLLRIAFASDGAAKKGIFVGNARIAQLKKGDDGYSVFIWDGPCIYPECKEGRIRAHAAPSRQRSQRGYVGICSEWEDEHSYRIYPNGVAVPIPDMDWSALPKERTE